MPWSPPACNPQGTGSEDLPATGGVRFAGENGGGALDLSATTGKGGVGGAAQAQEDGDGRRPTSSAPVPGRLSEGGGQRDARWEEAGGTRAQRTWQAAGPRATEEEAGGRVARLGGGALEVEGGAGNQRWIPVGTGGRGR